MSSFNYRTYRNYQERNKRKSSIQMNQNILNYFNKVNDHIGIKKIASLNDKKTEILKDSESENFQLDYERKNKAKKSLLYLLNIKSNGIFCPQILDYFEKMRESKSKENKHLEIKEKNIDHQMLFQLNENNNNNNHCPKLKSKFFQNKNNDEIGNTNHIKTEKHIKKLTGFINEENNIINNNESNNKMEKFEILNDNQNLKIIEKTDKNFTYNNKETKTNNDIIDELYIESKENKEAGAPLNEKKNKKKSSKKRQKANKIDMIYNLQRSELQKFGNYHSSLRTAIQSNMGRKKIIKRKNNS